MKMSILPNFIKLNKLKDFLNHYSETRRNTEEQEQEQEEGKKRWRQTHYKITLTKTFALPAPVQNVEEIHGKQSAKEPNLIYVQQSIFGR